MERQNEIESDKIYVQMFGSFRMTYQGQQIQLGKWLSAKMIHLPAAPKHPGIRASGRRIHFYQGRTLYME